MHPSFGGCLARNFDGLRGEKFRIDRLSFVEFVLYCKIYGESPPYLAQMGEDAPLLGG
ncbi:MAG: hypothetical protein ANABAC_2266 [Anaerolineae bacterium]|nr:MAG: hypothetical protein ANABAC_2266 [Anaerolineae bacterium]